MSVLDRSELEQSHLADLHAIASELGIEGFRRLGRDKLIDAILAGGGGADEEGTTDEGAADSADEAAESAEADTDDGVEIPKQQSADAAADSEAGEGAQSVHLTSSGKRCTSEAVVDLPFVPVTAKLAALPPNNDHAPPTAALPQPPLTVRAKPSCANTVAPLAATVNDHTLSLTSALPARSLTPLAPPLTVATYVAPASKSPAGSNVAVNDPTSYDTDPLTVHRAGGLGCNVVEVNAGAPLAAVF